MDVFVAGTGSFAAEIADWARATGARVVGFIEMLDPGRVGMVDAVLCDIYPSLRNRVGPEPA